MFFEIREFIKEVIKLLIQIAKFEAEVMIPALFESAEVIKLHELDNMASGFKNPTGAIESSVGSVLVSPFAIEIITNSPYAWRREEGFSGLTDSLGRFYPNDPGIKYAEQAIQQSESEVQQIFEKKINDWLQKTANTVQSSSSGSSSSGNASGSGASSGGSSGSGGSGSGGGGGGGAP